MSRRINPDIAGGNEFIVPVKTRLQPVTPVVTPRVAMAMHVTPALGHVGLEFEPLPGHHQSFPHRAFDFLHHHSVGVFALLSLLVGVSAIQLVGAYQSAQITFAKPLVHTAANLPAAPIKGPNMVVPSTGLEPALQKITSQPLTLTIAGKAKPIPADTIRGWLQIVPDRRTGVSYIHVDRIAITKSLTELAAPYVKAPVNQVVINNADGSSHIMAAGRNGAQIGDITPLVNQLNNDLLPARGAQLQLPIETLAFASVSPSAFEKLIEVNVVTKQMYLYEKGQLVRSYPISAGAPETPTLIGQFQIFSKPVVQDMRGFNVDGSRYFQPQVRWVNYFAPGGYAIHGNYWRPHSWFGAINSSHGCVSLPDAQAKEVYDWAPIGTTVIVHY